MAQKQFFCIKKEKKLHQFLLPQVVQNVHLKGKLDNQSIYNQVSYSALSWGRLIHHNVAKKFN